MTEHIFINYSRVDSIFADQLAVDLESRGYPVWIDQAVNRGGEAWREAVEQQLREAQEVVVVLSEASLAQATSRVRGLRDDLQTVNADRLPLEERIDCLRPYLFQEV